MLRRSYHSTLAGQWIISAGHAGVDEPAAVKVVDYSLPQHLDDLRSRGQDPLASHLAQQYSAAADRLWEFMDGVGPDTFAWVRMEFRWLSKQRRLMPAEEPTAEAETDDDDPPPA